MIGLFSFLDRQSKSTILLMALLLALFLGVIDYQTGYEVSFALFYLLPVSLAAWGCGKWSGAALSLVSAMTWYVSNVLAGEIYSDPFVMYWNTLTRLGFFMTVTFLLSELHHLFDQERTLARTDILTGAINRRAFYEIIDLEIERLRRYGRPFTVLYIDLDNFKSVNDQYGHEAGDRLLALVVKVLSSELRSVDRLARLGGDEFAVLLVETNPVEAQVVVPRLQEKLLTTMTKQYVPVTFSIGALTCTIPPDHSEDLITLADSLMYSVKNSTKNAIEYAVFRT